MSMSRLAIAPALVAIVAAPNFSAVEALELIVEAGQTQANATLTNPDDKLHVRKGGLISSTDHVVVVSLTAIVERTPF